MCFSTRPVPPHQQPPARRPPILLLAIPRPSPHIYRFNLHKLSHSLSLMPASTMSSNMEVNTSSNEVRGGEDPQNSSVAATSACDRRSSTSSPGVAPPSPEGTDKGHRPLVEGTPSASDIHPAVVHAAVVQMVEVVGRRPPSLDSAPSILDPHPPSPMSTQRVSFDEPFITPPQTPEVPSTDRSTPEPPMPMTRRKSEPWLGPSLPPSPVRSVSVPPHAFKTLKQLSAESSPDDTSFGDDSSKRFELSNYPSVASGDEDTDPESQYEISHIPPVDSGRAAWSFLIATTIVETVIWGLPWSIGVLHAYWGQQMFPGHEGTLALASTLQSGLMYLGCAIVGP